MSSTPAGTLLLRLGSELGRSAEQMAPIIKKVVEDGWYDSVESLRGLVDGDGWVNAGIPQRLADKLKEWFRDDRKSGSPPPMSVITEAGAPVTMSSIESMVHALELEIEFQIELPADTTFIQCVDTLLSVSGNILREPGNEKYRSVKTTGAKFQTTIARWSCAIAILQEMGFRLDGAVFVLGMGVELRKLSMFHEALEAAKVRIESARSAFNPYRESAVGVGGTTFTIPPERQAELDRMRKEAEELKKGLGNGDIGELVEPVKLVQIDSAVKVSVPTQHDEEEDGAILLANLRSIASASEQAQKFKSREKVEFEKLKKRENLPKITKIRILFSDKIALEMVVNSNETIGNVYKIFSEYVRSELRQSNGWALTVTPPFRKLDRSSKATLMQEDFVPAIIFRLMMNGVHCTSTDIIDFDRIK